MIKKKEKPQKINSSNKTDERRINENIKSKTVRVVGENIESNIYTLKDALELAYSMSLDLVEISPNSNPPVCKIIDYSKYKYDQKKFLEEKKSTKICMSFHGKLIKYKESGNVLLNKFIDSLSDIGEKEFDIKTEGKKIYTVISPSSKNKI